MVTKTKRACQDFDARRSDENLKNRPHPLASHCNATRNGSPANSQGEGGDFHSTKGLVGLTSGSLLIKVFVNGGEVIGTGKGLGDGWWCEVYKAGPENKLIRVVAVFPVELDILSDCYDFNVHYHGMEMWLRGVFIAKGKTTSLTVNISDR